LGKNHGLASVRGREIVVVLCRRKTELPGQKTAYVLRTISMGGKVLLVRRQGTPSDITGKGGRGWRRAYHEERLKGT